MSAKTYHYLYSPIKTDGSAPETLIQPLGATKPSTVGAIFVFLEMANLIKEDTVYFFKSAGFNVDIANIEKEINSTFQKLLVPKIPKNLSQRFKDIVSLEKDNFPSIDENIKAIAKLYYEELNLKPEDQIKKFRDNLKKIEGGSKTIYQELNFYFGAIVEKFARERALKDYKEFFKNLDSDLTFDRIKDTGGEPGTSGRQVKGDYFVEFKKGENELSFRLGVSVKGSRALGGQWTLGSQSFEKIAKKFIGVQPLELNQVLFGGDKLIEVKETRKLKNAKKVMVGGIAETINTSYTYKLNKTLWEENLESRIFFTSLVFDVVAFGYRSNRPLLKENWQSDRDGNPVVNIEFLYKIFENLAKNPNALSVSSESDGLGFKVSVSKSLKY